eukprot:53356-Eustigmatos_ZCMA.PRE.1
MITCTVEGGQAQAATGTGHRFKVLDVTSGFACCLLHGFLNMAPIEALLTRVIVIRTEQDAAQA